jgi:hypothetical protein
VDGGSTLALFDYALWRTTLDETMDLRADGNQNGVVDAPDFSQWRTHAPSYSAWYLEEAGGGGGEIPLVDFGNPPKVVNVTISGSNSSHPAYSFATHVGSGDQIRTVPVGGANTVSITFSEDVNILPSSLRVVGLYTARLPTLAEFSYDMASMTATWRFDDLVPNDMYLISVNDYVTDVEGNRLDGEWVNPASLATTNALVSEFPSGDGHAGGAFNFIATLLAGDAIRDLVIDDGDWVTMLDHWESGSAGFCEGDFTGDGGVGFDDFDMCFSNWGADRSSLLMLADLNGDLAVNSFDIDTLADPVGISDPTRADGDLNSDGVIDSVDLGLMFAQCGLHWAVAI